MSAAALQAWGCARVARSVRVCACWVLDALVFLCTAAGGAIGGWLYCCMDASSSAGTGVCFSCSHVVNRARAVPAMVWARLEIACLSRLHKCALLLLLLTWTV